MKKKVILSLSCSLLFLAACSDHSSEEEEDSVNSYHYDTTLPYDESVLNLDSISSCLYDSTTLEAFFKNDSVFIESQDGKNSLIFQSYIYYSQNNIKSVGAYAFNDTLKLELIEKEKSPDTDLFCPVMVYTTLKGKIEAKYISTASGVYALGNK